jgi:dihydrodipicolinate reductase
MNEKNNLMVYGYNGKLGSKICKFGEEYNYKIRRNLSNLNELKNCVIVDVTCVDGTSYLLDKLLENKINLPLIIGTTGDFNNIQSKINKYSIEIK